MSPVGARKRMQTIWFGAIYVSLLTPNACRAPEETPMLPPPPSVAATTQRFTDTKMATNQTSDNTDMAILIEQIKADKKRLVANNMDLTDAEAKQFWPLYDSYQTELQRINQQLGSAIRQYAEVLNTGSVPNETAEMLLKEALDVEEAEVKLKRSYAGKLENVLSPNKAVRYIQIENKIRAIMRADLAQWIPLAY
jgi:hypothetical protein